TASFHRSSTRWCDGESGQFCPETSGAVIPLLAEEGNVVVRKPCLTLHSRDNNLVVSNVRRIRQKRLRRRTGNIFPVQIKHAAVARAHDLFFIGIVLNSAVEMRTTGGKRPKFAFGRSDDEPRLPRQLKNLDWIPRKVILPAGLSAPNW